MCFDRLYEGNSRNKAKREEKIEYAEKGYKNDLYKKKSTVIFRKLIFYITYLSRIINDLQIILNINACLTACFVNYG